MLGRKIFVGVLTLLCVSSAIGSGKAPLFETSQRFHAVFGRHGVVASQELRASGVGLRILKDGGNAVDAAVATGFALMVTLPRAAGLGGGGFMNVWLARQHKDIIIDYRETAPLAATPRMFIGKDGSVNQFAATYSWRAAGVPGTVAGLCLAEKRYGKLGLKKVMEPAIRLAEHGIVVKPYLFAALSAAKSLLQRHPDSWRLFTDKKGKLLAIGSLLRRPDLAKSLKRIQLKGPKAFYAGPIAQKIVAASQAHGGIFSLADFRDYRAVVKAPLSIRYHGATVFVPPLPSSGVTLLESLKLLAYYPLDAAHIKQNSAAEFHLLVEVLNRAFYDRNTRLGDAAFTHFDGQQLLTDGYINALRKKINRQWHTPSSDIALTKVVNHEGHNTTSFAVMDRDHNVVTNTYSLNYSFGSGILVPETGILLNNTMDDFTIDSNHPNAFGLLQSQHNAIAPGKRPLSSIVPTIVLGANGVPWFATGSPGGPRIISSVLQLIINMVNYHLPVAAATARPRIHSQLFPDRLYYESGVSPDTLLILQRQHHILKQAEAMGSLQTVVAEPQGFFGYSDPRRQGAGSVAY